MQDLRLIGVHEDGQHLLLGADDGTRFRLPLSDDLRAAVRRGRPRQGHLPVEVEGGLRPRDVQALIRAGASAEDVADQAGWSVDKVRRYEGPILAEREHVAQLARAVRVRGRAQGGVAPTLDSRTTERLSDRGVNPTHAYWDAHRVEHGPWTVVVTFPAGGRERQASWHFDLPDRTITPLDDEARWLSGDDDAASTGPLPAPRVPPTGRSTRVYDVEAEGGLRATERSGDSGAGAAGRSGEDAASPGPPGSAGGGPSGREEPVDLMTAMRERSAASRASRRRRRNRRSPADVPQADPQPPEDALPLEDIPYATVTADVPPAAHAHPDPEGADGVPEPDAQADAEELAAEEQAADEHAAQEGSAGTTEREASDAEPSSTATEPATSKPETTGPEASEPETTEPEPTEAEATQASAQTAAQDTTPERAETVAEREAESRAPAAEDDTDTDTDAETADDTAADRTDAAEPADQSDAPGAATPPEGSSGAARPAGPKSSGKKRKSGRPSVPSWDDIMFGSRPGSD